MERILKLQSEQGFTETAIGGQFKNSSLIDLIIPGSGSYDLGKSYISLNMSIVPSANLAAVAGDTLSQDWTQPRLYNNDIRISGDIQNGASYLADCSTIVRNAEMYSANRGMVESIRNVNTLRSILWNFENDKGEQHDGLTKFGSFSGRRGVGNQTSSMLQVIGINTTNAGQVIPLSNSESLSRDFRIPLSDLFGVGSAMWNGDVFGDTRIHLDCSPNRLNIQQLGGAEATSAFDATKGLGFFGEMVDYAGAVPVSTPIGNTIAHPLTTTLAYFNPELDMPFYVGQGIEIKYQKVITGGATTQETGYGIIESIKYNSGDNTVNPPNGDQKVRIMTKLPFHTTAAGATETITNILVNALKSNAATDQMRFNRAEIVLSEMVGQEAPDQIDYTTYSTEETQNTIFATANTFNKQIIVEPNAQNLIIAHTNTGQISTDRPWESYRLSIDNVSSSGNRDVEYNKPLHRDRIMRFFNNRGQMVSNTSLIAINTGTPQETNQNQQKIFPILETLPLTATQKLVNLEITAPIGAVPTAITFYKELNRSI